MCFDTEELKRAKQKIFKFQQLQPPKKMQNPYGSEKQLETTEQQIDRRVALSVLEVSYHFWGALRGGGERAAANLLNSLKGAAPRGYYFTVSADREWRPRANKDGTFEFRRLFQPRTNTVAIIGLARR